MAFTHAFITFHTCTHTHFVEISVVENIPLYVTVFIRVCCHTHTQINTHQLVAYLFNREKYVKLQIYF